ncbi:hypothetical protein [uncultured Microbacterium sp.]|uniref:hypothetical protein n=1 Tax=uncultured Microbacterium sp. TaxID=191216 RepID=UPI00262697CF|nr:hypothetical protein [uncultured Microbacterium sp.]
MTTTTSDCGCHDSTASGSTKPAAAGVAARPVFVPKDAVIGATPAAPAASATTGTTVFGGFRGLNPQDGLFLRGEHLAAIQDYSRALTSALATASGTGIVHGLGVALTDDGLVVSPGLAISPRGGLLMLPLAVTIPLDDPPLPAISDDGFWRVELHWASRTSGSVPAYGSLCARDCGTDGATIRPWRDEGVEIRIVPDSLDGFGAVSGALRRGNWLSSAYFERERSNAHPWLVPGTPDADIPPVSARDWADATPLPDESGVPLGVLYTSDPSESGGILLQVWTGRRLVDGPAASAQWRARLAMRPWPVFLAQILQFETEVLGAIRSVAKLDASIRVNLAATHERIATLLDMKTSVAELFDTLQNKSVENHAGVKKLHGAYEKVQDAAPAEADDYALPKVLGIGELPPAGYLPVPERGATAEVLADFFGDRVDVGIRQLRADQIADELLAAQHRDRIPLHSSGDPKVKVDVLVPSDPADLPALRTPAYNWVAFVRRGPQAEQTEVDIEPVPVHVKDVGEFTFDDPKAVGALAEKLREDPGDAIGTVDFPIDSWECPRDPIAERILDALTGFDNTPQALLALTTGRRELAAVRAGLLWMSVDSGAPRLPIHVHETEEPERIIILLGQRQRLTDNPID